MKECKCVVPTETWSQSTHTHMVCTLLAKAFVLTQLQQTSPCCTPSSSSSRGRAHQSPSCLPRWPSAVPPGVAKEKGKKRGGQIDSRHGSFLPHSWTCDARELLYLALCEVLQQTKCHYETNRPQSAQEEAPPSSDPVLTESGPLQQQQLFSQYICSTLYCLDNTD